VWWDDGLETTLGGSVFEGQLNGQRRGLKSVPECKGASIDDHDLFMLL